MRKVVGDAALHQAANLFPNAGLASGHAVRGTPNGRGGAPAKEGFRSLGERQEEMRGLGAGLEGLLLGKAVAESSKGIEEGVLLGEMVQRMEEEEAEEGHVKVRKYLSATHALTCLCLSILIITHLLLPDLDMHVKRSGSTIRGTTL